MKSYGLIALILLIGGCMVITAYSLEQVTLTVHIHDRAVDGPLLSGVQVTGQDAAGKSFTNTTDSKGTVIISGKPGTWQFSLTKGGWEPLKATYEVTQTGEKDIPLRKIT